MGKDGSRENCGLCLFCLFPFIKMGELITSLYDSIKRSRQENVMLEKKHQYLEQCFRVERGDEIQCNVESLTIWKE